jgi:hypothetical protein
VARLSHFGEHDATKAADVALLQHLLQQEPQVLVRLPAALHAKQHTHVHQIIDANARTPAEHRSIRTRTVQTRAFRFWTAIARFQIYC